MHNTYQPAVILWHRYSIFRLRSPKIMNQNNYLWSPGYKGYQGNNAKQNLLRPNKLNPKHQGNSIKKTPLSNNRFKKTLQKVPSLQKISQDHYKFKTIVSINRLDKIQTKIRIWKLERWHLKEKKSTKNQLTAKWQNSKQLKIKELRSKTKKLNLFTRYWMKIHK